jgi:3-methyl-2-oxobutanoate hydroxymethyltransferase
VAEYISGSLDIPTIGIGSGTGCDIQSLILHDALGMFDRFTPRHSKQYAHVWDQALDGLKSFAAEVREKKFPADSNTFSISREELEKFYKLVGAQ